VRRALAELGPGARPLAVQAFVRDRLGLDVKTDLISYSKKALKRKGQGDATSGSRPPRWRGSQGTAPLAPGQAAPAAAAGGPKAAGIPLEDILYVKDVVSRLGAGLVRALIDDFAR
jgi:hypothetical protein